MTLDEAIKYCKDMAVLSHKGSGNTKCEQNHRQLAEWLRELKAVREAWLQLAETVLELRDNGGTGTQQDVCKFLVHYLGVLEKDIMTAKGDKK